MRKFLLLTAAVPLFAGCAWIEENPATAYMAVSYATEKVIEGDVERAQRVEQIALEVERASSGDAVATIDLLIELIRDEIDWTKLDSADTRLVNYLLLTLSDELKERYGDGLIPEDARLTVQQIAGWVIETARGVQADSG